MPDFIEQRSGNSGLKFVCFYGPISQLAQGLNGGANSTAVDFLFAFRQALVFDEGRMFSAGMVQLLAKGPALRLAFVHPCLVDLDSQLLDESFQFTFD
jgi:hypothetical protein